MKIIRTTLPEILLLEPRTFEDERGFFMESFNQRVFGECTGLAATFVQDNHSLSARHVLRGLHYQIRRPQGKLVRVVAGEVFDVAVDIRAGSPTFGWWVGARLSAENRLQAWIPPGFAHGFLATSRRAEVLYKTTDYRASEHERCIAWDDPDLAIKWPLSVAPIVSAKDRLGCALAQAELFGEKVAPKRGAPDPRARATIQLH